MSDLLAFLIKVAGAPLRFKLVGRENLPGQGPAIVVANHLGAVGPIAMMITFPIRLYPWIITDMMEVEKAPDYLYLDFIEPVWKLHGRFGRVVAKVVGMISTWLLKSLDGIPANVQVSSIQKAFKKSMLFLMNRKTLLIFPEKPLQAPDPETGIRPIATGFTWLCQMYQRQTGNSLPVIPALVHARRKVIRVGKPVELTFSDHPRQDFAVFKNLLELELKNLYREVEHSNHD